MDRVVAARSQQALSLVLLAGFCLGAAYLVSGAEVGVTALVMVGLTVGVVAFLRAEAAIYLIIVAMLLSPEIGIGELSGGERSAKGITLRFDDYLLVIIGLAWFFKSAVYKELNFLVNTPINKAMYLYSAACILSTLLGIQAGNVNPIIGSLFVLKYLEYFFLFWMVVNSTHSQAQIRRYFFVLVGVACVVSLVAILQIPSGARVTAPFQGEHGEPNTLASYLLLIMALVLGVALTAKKYGWALMGLFFFMLIPFIYTLSRTSYAAFVPVLYVLCYVTRKYFLMAALTIIALIVLAAPEAVLPAVVISRIKSTFGEPKVSGQIMVQGRRFDPSTEARLTSFGDALDAFQQKPLFGWGVTGRGFIDSQYFRVLIETGALGTVLFVYLMGHVFFIARKAIVTFRGRDPLFYGLSCGFAAGAAGLLVACLGTNVFIIVRIMEPFWLVCAMLCVLPTAVKPEESALPAARQVRAA
ncbi:MAG: O-antigen ligase family protein [Acidobacteria bacterium]|nr:O-antigen ligase family protein [Acidobacteriota bacterium]